MAKKAVVIDGPLNIDSLPVDTNVLQRGVQAPAKLALTPKKRAGEKRLSLALDGDTYRRLRIHAAMTDETHQDILERSLLEYLNRVNA